MAIVYLTKVRNTYYPDVSSKNINLVELGRRADNNLWSKTKPLLNCTDGIQSSVLGGTLEIYTKGIKIPYFSTLAALPPPVQIGPDYSFDNDKSVDKWSFDSDHCEGIKLSGYGDYDSYSDDYNNSKNYWQADLTSGVLANNWAYITAQTASGSLRLNEISVGTRITVKIPYNSKCYTEDVGNIPIKTTLLYPEDFTKTVLNPLIPAVIVKDSANRFFVGIDDPEADLAKRALEQGGNYCTFNMSFPSVCASGISKDTKSIAIGNCSMWFVFFVGFIPSTFYRSQSEQDRETFFWVENLGLESYRVITINGLKIPVQYYGGIS